MNDVLFDRWLYDSESDSLDFKKEQYRFIGATANEKSELLKDIVAMANSWRGIDGFIVIGIEDKPDKPNTLHGITEHIDDASLQQFVNSKLAGICSFEYRTFSKDSKTFGLIKVLVQKRPIYLSKDYGKLKANKVYVRRGSSTSEAKPDEVSLMGKDPEELFFKPNIKLAFYDDSKGKIIGTEDSFETTYLVITDEIPDYYSRGKGIYSINVMNQSDYYRDLIEYINFKNSFVPIRFAITNKGEKEAVNIRVEITIHSPNANVLLDGDEIPEPEESSWSALANRLPFGPSSYSADRKEDIWSIYNSLDRIHAKRTIELDGIIYLQVIESEDINFTTSVFFDGQPTPHQQKLRMGVKCNQQELSWENFYEIYFKPDTN